MGKVMTKVKLWNFLDNKKIKAGILKPIEVSALIDTGATTIMLPKKIAKELNLQKGSKVKVRYADERIKLKEVGLGVAIEVLGRETVTRGIIEPDGKQILIGQIILEDLDLIVDPKKGILTPRPESPDVPLLDML